MGEPTRPFRFSVIADGLSDREGWRRLARHAEAIGYDALLVADHLSDPFSPMVALQAAADATETLRVGTFVACNELRHPLLLAKEAATLDVLSGGRCELGIGAGWMRNDFTVFGREPDPPRMRVERLFEAVDIAQAFFTGVGERFTYRGIHYRVEDAPRLPRPVQHRGPPIIVGGAGERVLRFAAQRADVVSLSAASADGRLLTRLLRHDEIAARLGRVREAASSRPSPPELNVILTSPVMVTNRRRSAADDVLSALRAGPFETAGFDASDVLASPCFALGTVDEICDQLLGQRDVLGISSISVRQSCMGALAPVVERLRAR